MKKQIILFLALTAIFIFLGTPAEIRAKSQPAAEKQDIVHLADLPQKIRDKISQQLQSSEYEITSCEKPIPSGETCTYHAFNRRQEMSAYFTGNGMHLVADNGTPLSWNLEMHLSFLGYEKAEKRDRTNRPAAVSVSGRRIEYRHDGFIEWYVNDDRGLEQGVTLSKPPAVKGDGPVIVTWTLSGSLTPILAKDGSEIIFQGTEGQTVLRYSGLKAWDASGRPLSASLAAYNAGLDLRVTTISCIVDDTGASYPVTIDPVFSQTKKLMPEARDGSNDHLGTSVSISGDTMVVGAYGDDDNGGYYTGSVHVFYRNQGGTDAWGRVTKVTADDGATGDLFGGSVSVSGDTMVVGADDSDGNVVDSGSAYVFYRDQGGADAWGQVAKIVAGDGETDDHFGFSVSISGDIMVVGAPWDDDNGDYSGSAYVFYRNQGGADTWGQVIKIIAGDGEEYDGFGRSVSVSGDTLVAGAYHDDAKGNFSGSAYIFYRDQGGADTWGQVTKITADDGANHDDFGSSVYISGDALVVGAPHHWFPGQRPGSAYIFYRDRNGADAWGQVAKITPGDGTLADIFGSSVSISGDTVVVGACRDDDDGTESGSAYIFYRNRDGIDAWGQVAKLTASDGEAQDFFGISVSISADTVVAGSPYDGDKGLLSGSAYVFYRDQGGADSWGQVTKLISGDDLATDYFGYSIAVNGDTLVVGAIGDAGNGIYSGAAYIFYRNLGGAGAWGQVTRITAEDGSAEDSFGWAVAISGDVVVVGAQGDDDNGESSGSAYVFYRDQGGSDAWGQVAKLTASDGVASDQFGNAVSIDGDTAVVGAVFGTSICLNSGSAYIFYRNRDGADAWGQVAKITTDEGETGDQFGSSVSISGDTVVVGMPLDDDNGNSSGSAYVYYRNHDGIDAWGQVTKITPDDGAAYDHFGAAVSINGDTVVVGTPFDDNKGSAYLFYRNRDGIDAWGQVAKITPDDGSTGDRFGWPVSISGDKVLAGASYDGDKGLLSGSAYIFSRNQGGTDTWGQVQKLTPDDGVLGDFFGCSVSISGDTVAVGAYGDDDNGNLSGSAYVFTLKRSAIPQILLLLL